MNDKQTNELLYASWLRPPRHNNTILWIIHEAIAPLNILSCAIVYSLFVIIEHLYKEPQPDEAR